MDETRGSKSEHTALKTIAIIIGLVLPLIPAILDLVLLGENFKALSTAVIATQIIAVILNYVGMLLAFISAMSLCDSKIGAVNGLLWTSFALLFVSAVIQMCGLGVDAPYNPIQAFIPSSLPLLALSYANKRSGKRSWSAPNTWAWVLLSIELIAWIWITVKFGWNNYEKAMAIEDQGLAPMKIFGLIDAGTILCYLIGVFTLLIGINSTPRMKNGLGVTEWIGILLLCFLPMIYVFCRDSIEDSVVRFWRCWTVWFAGGFTYIFALFGYLTGGWNKELVNPKGDEVHEDPSSEADKNWNNY